MSGGAVRHVEKIATATVQTLEKALTESTSNPFDTHPPLAQRLAALEQVPGGKAVEDRSLALTLLDHVEKLEAQRVSLWMPTGAVLKTLSWKETGVSVLLHWQQMCKENAELLRNLTLSTLLETVARIPEFAKKPRRGRRRPLLMLWLVTPFHYWVPLSVALCIATAGKSTINLNADVETRESCIKSLRPYQPYASARIH